MRLESFLPWSCLFSHPELEGPVIEASGYDLPIGRNVKAHHLAFVAGQSLQRGPGWVSPDLGCVIIGTSKEEIPWIGSNLTPVTKF